MKFQQAAVAMLALLFTSVAAGADQRRLEAALRKSITDTWDKWNQGSRRDEEARYATAEFIEAFERLRRRPIRLEASEDGGLLIAYETED